MSDDIDLVSALEHVFGKENVIVLDGSPESNAQLKSAIYSAGMPSQAEIEKDLRDELGDRPFISEMAGLMWTAGITREDNPDDYQELLAIYSPEDAE